ncbi:hypothetical protein BOTBODRAFT_118270, partial [Botryobasidium botryosum FD-172 SS1]
LLHEAGIWRKLDHPNIIPFLGLPSIDGLPHLMSPLMQNGGADDFVKKNPNANRLRLVSMLHPFIFCTTTPPYIKFVAQTKPQLVQVAQGLNYPHTRDPPVIHGDLKANNILVSEDGSACISDFGLS